MKVLAFRVVAWPRRYKQSSCSINSHPKLKRFHYALGEAKTIYQRRLLSCLTNAQCSHQALERDYGRRAARVFPFWDIVCLMGPIDQLPLCHGAELIPYVIKNCQFGVAEFIKVFDRYIPVRQTYPMIGPVL